MRRCRSGSVCSRRTRDIRTARWRTQQLSTEMLLKQATPQVGRSIQALETERIKTEFFAKQSCGIQFDYDAATRTIL